MRWPQLRGKHASDALGSALGIWHVTAERSLRTALVSTWSLPLEEELELRALGPPIP